MYGLVLPFVFGAPCVIFGNVLICGEPIPVWSKRVTGVLRCSQSRWETRMRGYRHIQKSSATSGPLYLLAHSAKESPLCHKTCVFLALSICSRPFMRLCLWFQRRVCLVRLLTIVCVRCCVFCSCSTRGRDTSQALNTPHFPPRARSKTPFFSDFKENSNFVCARPAGVRTRSVDGCLETGVWSVST